MSQSNENATQMKNNSCNPDISSADLCDSVQTTYDESGFLDNVNIRLLKITQPKKLFGRHSEYKPEFPTSLFSKENSTTSKGCTNESECENNIIKPVLPESDDLVNSFSNTPKIKINDKKAQRNVFRRSSRFKPEIPSSLFYNKEASNQLDDKFCTSTPFKRENADCQALNLSSIPLPPSSSISKESVSKSRDTFSKSVENHDASLSTSNAKETLSTLSTSHSEGGLQNFDEDVTNNELPSVEKQTAPSATSTRSSRKRNLDEYKSQDVANITVRNTQENRNSVSQVSVNEQQNERASQTNDASDVSNAVGFVSNGGKDNLEALSVKEDFEENDLAPVSQEKDNNKQVIEEYVQLPTQNGNEVEESKKGFLCAPCRNPVTMADAETSTTDLNSKTGISITRKCVRCSCVKVIVESCTSTTDLEVQINSEEQGVFNEFLVEGNKCGCGKPSERRIDAENKGSKETNKVLPAICRQSLRNSSKKRISDGKGVNAITTLNNRPLCPISPSRRTHQVEAHSAVELLKKRKSLRNCSKQDSSNEKVVSVNNPHAASDKFPIWSTVIANKPVPATRRKSLRHSIACTTFSENITNADSIKRLVFEKRSDTLEVIPSTVEVDKVTASEAVFESNVAVDSSTVLGPSSALMNEDIINTEIETSNKSSASQKSQINRLKGFDIASSTAVLNTADFSDSTLTPNIDKPAPKKSTTKRGKNPKTADFELSKSMLTGSPKCLRGSSSAKEMEQSSRKSKNRSISSSTMSDCSIKRNSLRRGYAETPINSTNVDSNNLSCLDKNHSKINPNTTLSAKKQNKVDCSTEAAVKNDDNSAKVHIVQTNTVSSSSFIHSSAKIVESTVDAIINKENITEEATDATFMPASLSRLQNVSSEVNKKTSAKRKKTQKIEDTNENELRRSKRSRKPVKMPVTLLLSDCRNFVNSFNKHNIVKREEVCSFSPLLRNSEVKKIKNSKRSTTEVRRKHGIQPIRKSPRNTRNSRITNNNSLDSLPSIFSENDNRNPSLTLVGADKETDKLSFARRSVLQENERCSAMPHLKRVKENKKLSVGICLSSRKSAGVKSGYLEIEGGGQKSETTTRNKILYTVWEGKAVVSINGDKFTVNSGGEFVVGKDSTYSIKNVSRNEKLMLHFIKIFR